MVVQDSSSSSRGLLLKKKSSYLVAKIVSIYTVGLHLLTFRISEPYLSKDILTLMALLQYPLSLLLSFTDAEIYVICILVSRPRLQIYNLFKKTTIIQQKKSSKIIALIYPIHITIEVIHLRAVLLISLLYFPDLDQYAQYPGQI